MNLYNKNIIPLYISLALIFYSMLMFFLKDYILSVKHYIGFALCVFSFILYFKKQEYYFYFFAITLVLGIVGIIDFFYISLSISISLLKFNPVFVILLILFFVFNKDEIEKNLPNKKTKSNDFSKSRIKSLLKDYQNKTDINLMEIEESNKYTQESKIAASQILENRKKQTH